MKRRYTEVGLTLIELLVALALTALIMAAMPTALRLANRALGTVDSLDRDDAESAALDLVSRNLTQTLAIYERGRDGRLQVLFRGETNALTFVAPATLGPAGGVFRFELTTVEVTTGKPGVDVMLAWTLYRPPAAENVPRPERRERVLIANAAEFSLNYFGSQRTDTEPEWSTSWPATDTIPDLVEIRLAVPRSGGSAWRTIRVPLRLKPGR
jgi:Prokaryotic N-terminal methylation motif